MYFGTNMCMINNNNINIFFTKYDLLKEFPALSNFGALWCTIWQLCCENDSSDLGYINSAISVKKLRKFII